MKSLSELADVYKKWAIANEAHAARFWQRKFSCLRLGARND